MNARDIIKYPCVSEKAAFLAQTNNTFTFVVDKRANKIQIAEAIEEIFAVKVEKVNIINSKPKKKRMGRYEGKTNYVAKAMIKLVSGHTIPVFDFE